MGIILLTPFHINMEPRGMHAKVPVPFTLAGTLRGAALGWPFLLSSGATGLAMGVACRQVGMDAWLATFFSASVYSGTAQSVSVQLIGAGAPALVVLVAALAVNARYLAMGAQLAVMFPDVPRRRMLPALFLLGDGNWLIATAEAERGRRDAGLLLGAGLPMAAGWIAGTAAGHVAAVTFTGPIAAAAAFVPLGFVVAYLPAQWEGRPAAAGWAAGATAGLALTTVAAPHWAMLGGGIAGTAVSVAVDRRHHAA
jgi:predicted branched-subunit amino acid permease